MPLYSSTSSDSTVNADSQLASQEEREADNQPTTDTMSQDDDSQLDVVGDGHSSDSMAFRSPDATGLPDSKLKVSLAAKVKRNAAAKVKAKSVRHQRVLKRGGAGKTLPSSKRRKTREPAVGSKSGDVDDVDESIGPPARDMTVERSPMNGTDGCQDGVTDLLVNTPR